MISDNYAVNAATGQQVWVTNTGDSIPFVDEQNLSQPLTSFAAGEGLLVVPTNTKLIAYEGDTTPPTLTFRAQTPAPNGADRDGHLYTIFVSGFDQAGNSTTATTTLRIN